MQKHRDQDRSSYSDSRLMSCDETLRNRECYRTFRHLSDSAKREPSLSFISVTFWMEFSRQDVIDHAVTIRASVLQRESFAMLHTVFDQASFKRLEGARAIYSTKKIISRICYVHYPSVTRPSMNANRKQDHKAQGDTSHTPNVESSKVCSSSRWGRVIDFNGFPFVKLIYGSNACTSPD
ncbi:hypothetical protein BGY98DRAFT_976964 [Russula aff. rugulosa BPL654]|nr:hypothetical protein BGY98DRAFT_976964 [Russula aff. rugulosa BPL654]